MKTVIMVLTVFVAVLFTAKVVQACYDGDVRLIGGATSREGIVEICNGGAWGTVCENGWHVNDAKVVCRHLGYPVDDPFASTSTVPCCGYYGSRSGYSFLHSVNCIGTESSLLKCMHDGIDRYSCHSRVAGVMCPPCNNGDVQLMNGSTATEGRVEVCVSGAWSGVCSDGDWNFQDAFVTCRQLGYPATGAVAYSFPYFGKSVVNSLSNFLCYGNESRLFDCINTQRTLSCNSAGVRCQGENFQEVPCFSGSVNLVGGRNSNEGRVEVCSNGLWGTICDGDWDTREADVVCKQQGVQNSRHFVITKSNSNWFGGGSGPIFSVSCDGTESSLKDCVYSNHISDNCDHSRDVGVQCVNLVTSDCTYGDVRLTGGQNDAEGTVEVCNNNVWGFVCDTYWDYNDAAVVCSQLGYQGSNLTVYSNTYFGESSGPCHLDELNCTGYEANVLSCSRNSIGPHNCNCAPGNEAGVKCNATQCSHGDVRLVGGYTDYEGYVEVCINGYWGHICPDGWDNTTAMVVCKQLFGDSIQAVAFPTCCYYPRSDTGAGNTTLYNLHCSGSPSRLINCSYNLAQVRRNSCFQSHHAAVRCYVNTSCTTGDVALADGRSAMEGRVEVCINGVWGAVYGEWTFSNARVICRQLRFPSEWAIPLNGSFFGRGNSPILIDHVGCTGEERTLRECVLNTLEPASTNYHSVHVLSVICQGNINSQHECSSGNLRLVGGERENEGRVEICVEGFWGTACDSGWGQEEAMVVCSQSGYNGVGSVPVGAAYFGGGNGPIVSISCSGTELHISECMNTTGLIGCYHGKDAGVKCLAQPYDVAVTTQPSNGPFPIGSMVILQCNVDPPPPPGVMLYTWKGYENLSSIDSSLPNVSMYINSSHPRRAWYHCRAHVGGVFLGVGSTVITVKGLLHPIQGSAIHYTPPKTITLQVELTATITLQRYLSRLTWYYKGAEVIPAGRVSLSNDHMTLTITNSTESDAGMYEARFTRLLVYPYSKVCNDAALEAVEHYPAFLPAQFCVYSNEVLKESQCQTAKCNDSHTFATSIEFTSSDNVTAAVILRARGYIGEVTSNSISWNFNGLSLPLDDRLDEYKWHISRELFQSLHIDNAAFIDRGVYEAQLKSPDIYSNRYMFFVPGCTNPNGYGGLLNHHLTSSMIIDIDVADIHLKYYEHPTISAVAENFIIPAGSSLSQDLVCNATGGYPPISSISWVRNGRIIIENTTGDTVVLTTGAEGAGNPFGLFLCRVNKSVAPTEEAVLIRERGKLQIDLYTQCSGWKDAALQHNKEALQRSLVTIIQVQCSCSFTISDIEDTAITCSGNGDTITLTASLVYSSDDGTITASRVIRMLQDWAMDTEDPSLSLDGNSSATVSKVCSPACVLTASGGDSTNAVAGSFFGGLLLGLILAAAAATTALWVLQRRRAQESGRSAVPPKSASAVKPLRAAKPVIQDQTPDSGKIRYTTRDARGVNVQQQDWYEPMGYPNQDVYENPV